ncbi:hypothetical protein [Microbacterium sp.]|uniref:hypothetical protein n=1 Tax=Microbacterium sp. TaxID=51671 RepID=UPI0028124030|nr:hypothetical protein [Microbacterium sp.]
MSKSDQQGQGPLTRKQLREIRLTGSTPVISPDEAAAAAAAPPSPPSPPAPSEPRTELAADSSLASDTDPAGAFSTPLTRRQVREKERSRTGSVPVSDPSPQEDVPAPSEPTFAVDAGGVTEPAEAAEPAEADEPADAAEQLVQVEALEPVAPTEDVARGKTVEAEIVSEVPRFGTPDDDESDVVDDEVDSVPVSATAGGATTRTPLTGEPVEPSQNASGDDIVDVLGIGTTPSEGPSDDDVLADVGDDDDSEVTADERPTVNPGFGQGLLSEEIEHKPFSPSFDELLTVNDSTGSQHIAPSALIFTQGTNGGSLSGPVAATGEVLVTGSYELPQGLGSQGHAHGTTDGREVDAVLIDGELPPASSPTPIAASSAVSTIKSAGEVIRPPAPEKGNKLMLTLAITAGGLALALAVALIVAFTTNVF